MSSSPAPSSALNAARELGLRHGIQGDAPRVLKDGSNLLVALDPAPVVVRVATLTAAVRGDPLPWLEREVALTVALVDQDASVAPPSPLLPPGPHVIDGWAMTAWALVEHDPAVVPGALQTLDALERLHGAMRRLTIDLPLLGPARDDLDRALAFAVRQGLVSPDDAAALRARRDAIADRLLAVAPDRQPLHGDAFPRNSLMTADGVVWIDFEDCCQGPAAWDHGILLRRTEDPAVAAFVRARDGDEAIDLAIELRTIQADVWAVIHEAREDGRLVMDRAGPSGP